MTARDRSNTSPTSEPRRPAGTARIVAIQPVFPVGAVEENLPRLEDLVRDAVTEHEPDVIVLPESAPSPLVPTRIIERFPRPIDGAPLNLLRQLSRELGVVLAGGFLARRGGGVRDTYLTADPDGRVCLHDHACPAGWERQVFAAGEDDRLFALGIPGARKDGQAGVPVGLVCGTEWAKTATARQLRHRAHLVIGGRSAFTTQDSWQGPGSRRAHREQLRREAEAYDLPARIARLTGAPVALAAHAGAIELEPRANGHGGHYARLLGETQIVDSKGTVLARMSARDGEGYISADVSIDEAPIADELPPNRSRIAPPDPIARAAIAARGTHGVVSYRARRLLRRHLWQSWPAADLPNEVGPVSAGENLPAITSSETERATNPIIAGADMTAPSRKTSVLMVLSAADHWTLADGTPHPTGFWAEEFVEPHRVFTTAGWDITIATPGGARPTVDQSSLGIAGGLPSTTARHRRYLQQHADDLANPVVLADIDPDAYDIVFYPGGHGPMEDLVHDADSAKLLTRRLQSEKPLALLCHAPAAAVAARDDRGRSAFSGRRMTAFSNREETLNGLAHKAPWLLEDRLRADDVDYVRNPVPLAPYITVDGNLYTGQNPTSSRMLARRIVADLTRQPHLKACVSRTIAAPPDAVHAALSDISNMGRISPETYSAFWVERGKRYVGLNRIGPIYQWATLVSITEDRPGRVFAFHVAWPSNTSWRYELEPDGNGATVVTETMTKADPQMALVRGIQRLVGVPDRLPHLRAGMNRTLERLDYLVTGR